MAEFNLTPVFRMEMFIDAIINGKTPPEPQFREEFYFAKVAGMDVELPTPINRREFYLAKYAGMDVDPPAPVTRDEMYLALACGLGVEPPEPVFRDEYWLYELSGGGEWSWKTVSGSMIHITDAVFSPMQKCEVTLEPIQDLHGQDAPYPAGGGKNKLNTEGTDTNNGYVSGKYLNNAGTEIGAYVGYITEYTPIKPSTEYTLSGIYGSAPSICFYDSNKNYISSVQYSGVTSKSFTTPADAAYYRASVKTPEMETSGQLEEGSTATPWSPYKNICPITGWTGCDVKQNGVNFCSVSGTGEFERTKTVNISPLPIGSYYISAVVHSNDVDANTCAIAFYNTATGQYVSSNRSINRSVSDERCSVSFTITDVCDRLIFYASSSYPASAGDTAEFSDIQISLLDEETYHDYTGTTLSVTFPDGLINQWDEETELGTLDTVTGQEGASNSIIRAKNFVPVVAGNRYRVVTKFGSNNGIWMMFYDNNKEVLTSDLPSGSYASNNARRFDSNSQFIAPQNCAYIRWYFKAEYGTTYLHDTSINYPSTVTTYHPYHDDAVYKCKYDMISGKLTILSLVISDADWYYSGTSGFTIGILNYGANLRTETISSHYRRRAAGWGELKHGDFQAYAGIIGVKDYNIADLTAWRQYLADQKAAGTPVKFIYPLDEPIEIQLTPQQIRTLKDENNVWGSGDLEITYKAQA